MLIAVLFLQEAIKVSIDFTAKKGCGFSKSRYLLWQLFKSQGVISEFRIPKAEDTALEKYQFQWLYLNGLLAIVFSFGMLVTALKSRRARSWRYTTGKWIKIQWLFSIYKDCPHWVLCCSSSILLFYGFGYRVVARNDCRLWSSPFSIVVVSIVLCCTQ